MRWMILLCCALFVGCSIGPTQEEFDKADFGPPPTGYESIINSALKDGCFDPFSAVVEIYSPQKYWWRRDILDDIHYGWRVIARINAKNRFGAYVGWNYYDFIFKNNKCISINYHVN